ncbi:MAG TPA: IMP dehydrogenase, partial [Patescibacteria group bacterium]|nr:IMP dehydrogenase [Patescibacteria group bacterium]
MTLSTIQEYLTFDDVLILPGYSDFSRSDIDLTSKLTRTMTLKLPLMAAPMDTVCDSRLAIALGRLGGLGIIHRNLTIADEANEVKKVKDAGLVAAAAIGASNGYEDRMKAIVSVGLDVVVVDSAHGFDRKIIEAIKFIKKNYPKLQVIGGNIATAEGARALISAGADGLRVGMGPGAICTTRIVSGMGVPQLTAIFETVEIAKKAGVPVIADGGIKYSGDMVKALALGASTVMMGSYFAGASEAPGKIVSLRAEQVPGRFKSSLNKNLKIYRFKEYHAMGSIAAMKRGAKIKSEDEFHGKSYKDRVMIAEGVESLVPLKGSVKDIIDQAVGGIKSGMYYVGAKNLNELTKIAKFTQITQASLTESHPHDVLITNGGQNYQ